MRHRHTGGSDRHFHTADTHGDHHTSHHTGHHRHRGGSRHGSRLFDYGELRLLILAMIADQPRHGYELIKVIEERFGGSYTPSPGVVYPTLAWLDDMGYATIETDASSRKRYKITPEGEAFLVANRAAADELLSRAGPAGSDGRGEVPAPVARAMENLKVALRLRISRGRLDQAAGETIAAALDAVAQIVERS